MSDAIHLRTTYHLPSWQGGDKFRPLCHRKRVGLDDKVRRRMTVKAARVTCMHCRRAMAEIAEERARPAVFAPESPPAPPPPPPVSPPEPIVIPTNVMRQIAEEVAHAHGLTLADLRSVRQTRQIAHARQEAMWRIRQLGRSTPQIGRFFGRDHTTVIHACREHERRMLGAEAA